jgi:hypothetical protein
MDKILPLSPDAPPLWRIVPPPHKSDGVAKALQYCFPLRDTARLTDEIGAMLDRLSAVKPTKNP